MHIELFNFTEHEQLNLSDDFLISEHFLCNSEIPQYSKVSMMCSCCILPNFCPSQRKKVCAALIVHVQILNHSSLKVSVSRLQFYINVNDNITFTWVFL